MRLAPNPRPACVAASLAALAAAALGSCTGPVPRALPVSSLEERYRETRALKDAIDVTLSRGALKTPRGVALADLLDRYAASRARLGRDLAAATPPTSELDARALEIMRRTLATDLVEASPAPAPAGAATPDCDYDPERLVREGGAEALSQRMYACFGRAARRLRFEGEATDRLTLLGRLALTPDPGRREQLWRALAPIWEAVNADNGPSSPYRTLVRESASRLRREGRGLGDPVRSIGVDPAVMQEWLVRVLEAWRAIAPDAPLEPWDFSYEAGAAQRALRPAIPLASLRPINDAFYRALGADPAALQVEYDLEPRAGKTPVAFTTFGRRPWREGDRWIPGEPWIFASYRMGGLDNLLELLHETGHAIHIAAIRTRPAFCDWPDSDIFTEAVADLAALEIYEPAWQERYLGESAPLATGIRAKYAGIVMDIAWALFEVRMHRDPALDPNRVWTEITRRYFRIQPHPDRAWWAVRGQLVEAPGYMLNYAAGAILVADLRARLLELYGPSSEGDPSWYERVAGSLYRFGLERPSVDVIEDFLGRPVSPRALLDDLARACTGRGAAYSCRSQVSTGRSSDESTRASTQG